MLDTTVIIPAHNAKQHIEKTLSTILVQTYNNYEVLIVNDGSADETESICKQYSYLNNVRILTKPNNGLSSAINVGVENASGEKIIICDADDWLAPTCVERVSNELNSFDYVVTEQVGFSDTNNTYKHCI